MQRKSFKRALCLLLTLLTVLPLIVATGLFTAAAATETYRVVNKSSGSIQYKGKNYANGATNQTLTFGLSSGFLLESSVTKDPYWGTCIYSGRKDPPLWTVFSNKLGLTDLLMDGLNQNDVDGSHYMVSPVTGSAGTKDSTAGHGREIDARFAFACFYYAWKYRLTEFSALDERDCSIQEAVAIAYRSEWDVRLIKYGYGATTGTGTWNNATKQWSVNTNVSNWKEDTTHFGGVTDGNSTHKAIVDAANAILKYAISDPDGVRGSGGVKSVDGGTRFEYSVNGGTYEMFSIAGPTNPDTGKQYQNLLLFRGPEPDDKGTPYSIRVRKVDLNDNTLPGATFALYKKDAGGTYRLFDTQKAMNGVAEWTDLELTDYYVEETAAPPGYERDLNKYYITQAQLTASETITIKVTNLEEATATWTPLVAKVFEGGDLTKHTFTFILEEEIDGSRKELQRVQNKSDGSIPFKPLEYTGIGIHYYYVREVIGNDPSVTYDKAVLPFAVIVSRNGNDLVVRDLSGSGVTRIFSNMPNGAIGVKKVDQNGKPLEGVKFSIWRDPECKYSAVGAITTNSQGIATYGVNGKGEYTLEPGITYYVQEASAPTGYKVDPTIYPVTVVRNQLTYVNNGLAIPNESATGNWTPDVKKVFEGGDLTAGQFWFQLFQDGVSQPLQTVTNEDNGKILFEPVEYTAEDIGKKYTYYIKEVDGGDPSIIYDDHTVEYTVEISYSGSGMALTVEASTDDDTTFTNTPANGAIGVKKVDQNKKPLAGVTFGIYLDPDLAEHVGSITTDTDGIATYGVNDDGTYTLDDGTVYYVRETSVPDGYVLDTTVYSVTVIAGQVTYINNGEAVVNDAYGAIGVKKVDQNRRPLAGVKFGVYTDPECTPGSFETRIETDAKGIATYGVASDADGKEYYTRYPGKVYYLRELEVPNGYILDATVYKVTVVSGELTYANDGVPIVNEAYGAIGVRKVDENGEPLKGAVFGIYTDPECTPSSFETRIETDEKGVATYGVASDENGKEYYTRYPGKVYYVRELTAPAGYVLDATVYKVAVKSGVLTYVNNGRPVENESATGSWTPDVNKVFEGGDLTEWQFTFILEERISDTEWKELQRVQNNPDGSIPFEAILYDAHSLGEHQYIIREVIDEGNDLVQYDEHAVVFNVSVTHESGAKELTIEETVEGSTTFRNRLQKGKIEILKTDTDGTPLAGAEFLLEWSEDSIEWIPVTYAAEFTKGGCTSPGLTDGKLITDSDGRAVFEELDASLYYRLTETKAPEGMQLLTEPAFEGLLPEDGEYVLSLHVVNAAMFKLPAMGSGGFRYVPLAAILLSCCAGMLWLLREKRKKS